MVWIRTIPFAEATGRLQKIYRRVAGPDNNVDNIMMAHSLRPHGLEGHMALYKSVLHHTANRLPKWLLEALGVYVSLLNRCDYCVDHHSNGFLRLIGDAARGSEILAALAADAPARAFSPREAALFDYAKRLTQDPAALTDESVQALRGLGWDDGEILEVNQVAAYFNYANRTVLGLGITTEGDIVGLSPNNSDDPDDWGHR